MRLLIDGNETALDLAGIETVRDLLDDLYRRTAGTGRVVYRVEIDGRDLSASAEKEMAAVPLADVGRICVTTNSPEELLRNGLEGAIALCDAICADIGKTTEAFRLGEGERGRALYVACVESLGTFFQLSGAILNGFRAGFFSGAKWPASAPEAPSDATADILGRLLEHQKGEDWTAMADVLEFEVAPNLGGWRGFFSALKDVQEK
jgi:hypothetical protein